MGPDELNEATTYATTAYATDATLEAWEVPYMDERTRSFLEQTFHIDMSASEQTITVSAGDVYTSLNEFGNAVADAVGATGFSYTWDMASDSFRVIPSMTWEAADEPLERSEALDEFLDSLKRKD